MKIAICEDSVTHQNLIQSCIKEYPIKQKYTINIHSSGESLLETYNRGFTYDVLFLDIKMKTIAGYQAAKSIRERDKDIIIIFVTSLIQYAVEGYSIGIKEFLLKPIDSIKFNESFERVLNLYHKKQKSFYTLKFKGNETNIQYKDIHYIESNNRKIVCSTDNGDFEQYAV